MYIKSVLRKPATRRAPTAFAQCGDDKDLQPQIYRHSAVMRSAAIAASAAPVGVALPGAYTATIAVSALLWSAAFAVFTFAYFPILSRPRLNRQPG